MYEAHGKANFGVTLSKGEGFTRTMEFLAAFLTLALHHVARRRHEGRTRKREQMFLIFKNIRRTICMLLDILASL